VATLPITKESNIKTWRTKQFNLRITGSRKLVISLRRFKTAKANRSQVFKQLVIPIYFSSIKEITIKQQRRKPRRRASNTRLANFKQKAAMPVLMIMIGASGIIFFTLQTTKANKLEPAKTFSSTSTTKSAPVKKAPKVLARSTPTHITVASVGINADVTPVGNDAAGSIEMPPLFAWTTGWYQYSPTPGELGPSIIVGHVDTYKGVSVFWKLREVKPDDIVEITRADGSVAKFKITALKQFEQANFPTQEVYGNIDYAGLRLITCGGAFNQATASYTQNTVVYASLIT
jgi:hypothetical protein